MKAVTSQLLSYSNEATIMSEGNLTAFLEDLHSAINDLTECQHYTTHIDTPADELDEDGTGIVSEDYYTLDDYVIGSLIIRRVKRDTPGKFFYKHEVYFTILVTDDPNDRDAQYQAHDTFNPIFLDAESPNSK